MKPLEPDASPVVLARSSPSPSLRQIWQPWMLLREMVVKTWVIAELEARKLRHDPTELFTRAVQPALWLLIFGQVFARVRAIPTGNLSYLDFMAPGILAQSVLFIAIFYGISVIWERDLGVLHKIMASP
ncbi:MAG: ABC transporter permease, partial [Thermanaerothrix sp.]|nr:ABC transporter permease [Thermanaerothrix sp.]